MVFFFFIGQKSLCGGQLAKTDSPTQRAQENRNTAIEAFKLRVFEEFDTDRALRLRAIRVFAELDCLFNLAKSSTAIREPSCRPEFVESDSALLGGGVGKIVLLTGERSIYP